MRVEKMKREALSCTAASSNLTDALTQGVTQTDLTSREGLGYRDRKKKQIAPNLIPEFRRLRQADLYELQARQCDLARPHPQNNQTPSF